MAIEEFIKRVIIALNKEFDGSINGIKLETINDEFIIKMKEYE